MGHRCNCNRGKTSKNSSYMQFVKEEEKKKKENSSNNEGQSKLEMLKTIWEKSKEEDSADE